MALKRFRFKNVDKVTKRLNKVFNDVKTEKRLLNEIGVFTRDRVRFNARTGKSLENNVSPVPLPALSPVTKKIRKKIRDNSPGIVDAKFFKPTKSNVTLTGQLLNALEYKIKNNAVLLSFKTRRKKFFKDDLSDNNLVYDALVKRGFGFVGLDEKGQDRVKKLVLDQFRRTIKKLF